VGFLKLNGYNLTASQPEAYRTMIALAAGAMSEDEFAGWIDISAR
jgi:prophage maintenance system killer protein